MCPLSSPGPDNFPPIFFQKFWNQIAQSVTTRALAVLNGDMSIKGANGTYITLIPKHLDPFEVFHFRPISLCNVAYKIVSKTIANRLQGIMDKVISP